MDRKDNIRWKKQFIKELVQNVSRELLADVPKMPENWDDVELREILAIRFRRAAYASFLRNRARKRDFNNEILVRNL